MKRHRRMAAALGVVLAFAIVPMASSAAAARTIELSNESTLSRWAYPNYESTVRAAPSARSRVVAYLHYLTEDRQLELYPALLEYVDVGGNQWVQVRLPMRPNGRIGWVRRSALSGFHVVTKLLVINRKTLRATLYSSGHMIWRAPVGVGRPSLPTPVGLFYAREKLRSLTSFYGPIAIGTSAYSKLPAWRGGGVVGIHGTSQPWLVPGRPSHGCVRLRNADIVRLSHLMPLGTPIRIL